MWGKLKPMARDPLPHQQAELERSRDERVWALYWQQRVGKSGVIIRTCEHQHRQQQIDAAVIVAYPSTVHFTWLTEWEKDWPEDLSYRALAWRSSKAHSAAAKAEREALLRYQGFSLVTLNCEALTTPTCFNYLKRFMDKRRVLLCADESSFMADVKAARTIRMKTLGERAVSKRITDGTPVDESPVDAFSQCYFLDPAILGHKSIYTFKARYAEMTIGYAKVHNPKPNGPKVRTFKTIAEDEDGKKRYRNLDELQRKMLTKGSRLLRSDVSTAPEKTYSLIKFELTDKQRAVYDRLVNEFQIELNGVDVPRPHVLARLTLLQMIARNYHPPYKHGQVCHHCDMTGCEKCDYLGYLIESYDLQRIDPNDHPAQDALADFLRQADEPVVVWCKFRQDVLDCAHTCAKLNIKAARYYGGISPEEREHSYKAFQLGCVNVIVATIESGLSRGHDLTRAGSLFYYSNSYSRRARGQSEDRAEGVLRTRSTGIFDLVALDTRDEDVLRILRHKAETAAQVMGDDKR